MVRAEHERPVAGGFLAACLLLAAAGCGGFTDDPAFRQTERLSPCDGFGAIQSPLRADPPAYCDAEVLYYTPAEDGTLTLLHTRALLNCCGEHHVRLELERGVFVMRETDDPERIPGMPDGARCACMCVFDFEVTAEGIPLETVPLRIELLVSDAEEPAWELVWEGSLDLAAGAGFEIIDPLPEETWCEQAVAP